jgi:hypothetical protein
MITRSRLLEVSQRESRAVFRYAFKAIADMVVLQTVQIPYAGSVDLSRPSFRETPRK